MSVIHIRDRTTSEEFQFSDQRSSHSSLLLVNKEAKLDRFSLELTVGTAWAKIFSPTNSDFLKVDAAGIRIGRHDSIVIEVAEDIHVPNNMYGILVPTGSLFLNLGILIAPAKIEPGYSGKLMLRLFNTTSEKYTLQIGQKLGSAIFFPTDTTINHETIKRERGASIRKYSRFNRLLQWARTNPLAWIPWIITLIGSSTTAVLITTYLLRQPQVPSQGSTNTSAVAPPKTAASQATHP